MNRGVNKVILLGNLGKDPELSTIPNSGDSVAQFSLATNDSWVNKDNEKVTRTEWHNLVVYGKLADIVKRYLKKGSKIYIEGRLKTSSWEKDGIKKYRTEVIVKELQMLGSAEDPSLKDESNYYGGESYNNSEEYSYNNEANTKLETTANIDSQLGVSNEKTTANSKEDKKSNSGKVAQENPGNNFNDKDDDIPF